MTESALMRAFATSWRALSAPRLSRPAMSPGTMICRLIGALEIARGIARAEPRQSWLHFDHHLGQSGV